MIYVIRYRNNPALSDQDRNLYIKIFEHLVEWYNKFDKLIQEVFKNKDHVLKEMGYGYDEIHLN